MDIAHMLVCSTCHVTRDTAMWLDAWHDRFPLVVYHKLGYGWLIPITDDYKEQQANIPGDLLALVEFTEQQGCTWLMIDRDADTIEELPEFDW